MSIFKVDTLTTWDGLKSATVAAIADAVAAVANKFDKAGGDLAGSLNFTGTGRRLSADLSHATVANRLLVQTNTTNGATSLRAIPNGTGNAAGLQVGNSANPDSQSFGAVSVGASEVMIESSRTGGGSFLPLALYTGNVARFRVTTTGSLLSAGGGIGYGPGSGGTVTQASSKATPVTLDKPSGRITTASSALAANTLTSFLLNNAYIEAGDAVLVTGGAGTNYDYKAGLAAAGVVQIFIRNITGSTLSEALTIDFKVIKGSTT